MYQKHPQCSRDKGHSFLGVHGSNVRNILAYIITSKSSIIRVFLQNCSTNICPLFMIKGGVIIFAASRNEENFSFERRSSLALGWWTVQKFHIAQ